MPIWGSGKIDFASPTLEVQATGFVHFIIQPHLPWYSGQPSYYPPKAQGLTLCSPLGVGCLMHKSFNRLLSRLQAPPDS